MDLDDLYIDHVTLHELDFLKGMFEGRLRAYGPNKALEGYSQSSASTHIPDNHKGTTNLRIRINIDHSETIGDSSLDTLDQHKNDADHRTKAAPNNFKAGNLDEVPGQQFRTRENLNQEASVCCAICHNPDNVEIRFGISICWNCGEFLKVAAQNDFFYFCQNPRATGKCHLTNQHDNLICKGCRLQEMIMMPGFDLAMWDEKRKVLNANMRLVAESSRPDIVRRLSNQSCGICSNIVRVEYKFGMQICRNCHKFINKLSRHDIPIPCIDGQFECDLTAGHGLTCSGCRINKAFQLGLQYSSLKNPESISDRATQQATENTSESITINEVSKEPLATCQANREITVNHLFSENLRQGRTCSICDSDSTRSWCSKGIKACKACHSFIDCAGRKVVPYLCENGKYACNLVANRKMCPACRIIKALDLGLDCPRLRILYDASLSVNQTRPTHRPIKKPASHCRICNRSREVFSSSKFSGAKICRLCYGFVKNAEAKVKSYDCVDGKFRCNLAGVKKINGRRMLCKGCRLRRAFRVGYRNTRLRKLSYRNLQSRPDAARARHQNTIAQQSHIAGEGRYGVRLKAPSENLHDINQNEFECYNIHSYRHDLKTQVRTTPSSSLSKVSSLGQHEALSQLCWICKSLDRVNSSHGIIICCSCAFFISSAEQKGARYFCGTGHYKCSLEAGQEMCRGCRMTKAFRLGLQNPKLRAIYAMPLLDHQAQPTNSSRSSPIKKHKKKKKSTCGVCGRMHYVSCSYGIRICCSCRVFIKKAKIRNVPLKCTTGKYNCPLLVAPGFNSCRGCRMMKALQLGLNLNELRVLHRDVMKDAKAPLVSNGFTDSKNGDKIRELSELGVAEANQFNEHTCAVCGNPNHVKFHKGLFYCCHNCMQSAKDNTLKCPLNGSCDISWKPGVTTTCRACRIEKYKSFSK